MILKYVISDKSKFIKGNHRCILCIDMKWNQALKIQINLVMLMTDNYSSLIISYSNYIQESLL